MEKDTPVVWLEKNLAMLTILSESRQKMVNEGKTFTEEQTNYFQSLMELKNKYEKSIALLKAAEID